MAIWDLMLEWGETLRTWRLAKPPGYGGPIEATPLPAHRRMYLDYEGPVSGGRGTVTRWDGGTYQLEAATPGVQVILHGGRLQGRAELREQATGEWAFALTAMGEIG